MGGKYKDQRKRDISNARFRKTQKFKDGQKRFYLNTLTKRRIELINSRGGKCIACGIKYDGENGPIFAFHHRESSTKKFDLSICRLGHQKEVLDREADKTDLYCMNCHTLLHGSRY